MTQQFDLRPETKPETGPETFRELSAAARRALDGGDLERARRLAARARAIAPRHPEAVILLGQLAEKGGDVARKVGILTDYLGRVGDNPKVRRQLAGALLQLDDTRAARTQVEHLLAAGIDGFPERKLLARICVAEGDLAQAEMHARRACEADPARPAAVILLAQIAHLREGPAQQAAMLRRFIDTHGESCDLRYQLATALRETGEFAAARACLASNIASPGARVRDPILLARLCADQGDYDWAEAEAQRAIGMAAPDHVAPILLLAEIGERRGGPERAVEILSGFGERLAQSFHLRMALAHALVCVDRTQEALELAQRSDPASDHELFKLIAIFEMCGRADLADACYRRLGETGQYGTMALLYKVLSGERDAAETLAFHAREGLRQDVFYHALLAHAKRHDQGADIALMTMAPEDRRAVYQTYAVARPYFEPPALAPEAAPLVSIVAPIHRPEDQDNLLRQLLRQSYPRLEVLVIINGAGFDAAALSRALERAGRFERVAVRLLPAEATLAQSLNLGIAEARGAYIARFDADDLYLGDYLTRSIGLMRTEAADVCGKSHLLLHFEELDMGMLFSVNGEPYRRRAGRNDVGSGSTLIFSDRVAATLRFGEAMTMGEDQAFYRAVHAAGFRLVLAPPFDHIVRRRGDKALHTWKLGDIRVLKNNVGTGLLFAGSQQAFETAFREVPAAVRAALGN